MSRKVSTFKSAIPAPKVVSEYIVRIPYIGLRTASIIEQATYPTEEVGEVAIWHKGQQLYFPTFPKVPGLFTCIIPEEIFVRNQISIDALRNIQLGNGKYVIMFDIFIALTYAQTHHPVPSSIRNLVGAFLLSVDPITLDASKPDEVLKWRLTFRYNYIEPLLKFPY